MNDGIVQKCPFCGKLYRTYSMMVGDQSCCPECRRQADENFKTEWKQG